MRLQEKVVLVTGAASGIGYAVGELFAKEGATVFASDIAPPKKAYPKGIEAITLDVTNEEAWEAAVDAVIENSGRLDVLINNAGIIAYEPLHELEVRQWQRLIAVDQTGVFLGMREAVRVMRRQKSGSIVNISSIWGSAAVAGAHSYHAAKGAVRNMSKNAAMTYVADGIRVNSVHPGFIHTPLTDAQAPALNESVIASTPHGLGSTFLHEALAAGEALRLSAPFGEFTVDVARDVGAGRLLLIAGGVGMTPIISVLAAAADAAYPGPITLLASFRSEAEAVFRWSWGRERALSRERFSIAGSTKAI
jgi:3alpha(or 20beta)-hydroxysteroid dehydrogenase